MNRRQLLVGAGGFFLVGRARAQAPRRVGVLTVQGGSFARAQWAGVAFVNAMKDLGYQEGRDFVFDERPWQKPEEVLALVRELIRLKVDVIVAAAPPSIVGAKSATDRVPIVMVFSADPVETGLVQSLNRPGGNLTGVSWDHGFATQIKQLELLKEALPNLRRIALMWDATDTAHPIYAKYIEEAGPRFGVHVVSSGIRSAADLDPAFAQMRKAKAEALIVLPSAQVIFPNHKTINALIAANAIPALSGPLYYDWSNALLVMSPNQSDAPRRVAGFVARILKGARPGELPIEQPTKYDLHVNLKVARRLGITVPQSVLVRADKVIE